jgi:putative ABC transport system permease protein
MPDWREEVRRRLPTLAARPSEAEVVEEMAQHLEDRHRALVAAGASDDDAYAAVVKDLVEELPTAPTRRNRGSFALDLGRDLRYAARGLRRSPGFAAVAIASLALGIGANTAIFQILDAVRLRRLPVPRPEELFAVQLADGTGQRGSRWSGYPVLTNPIWEELRDRHPAPARLFAWADVDFNLAPAGEVRPARGLWVSGDFFDALGVRAEMGRLFTAADDRRGCGLPGAVVSHALWQRELGGDPAAIGGKLSLDRKAVEVLGVAPASFFGPEVGRSFDVALLVCSADALHGGDDVLDAGTTWWLTVMGRLNPGASIEETVTRLRAASPGVFGATLPGNYPRENVGDYLRFRLTAVPAESGLSSLRERYVEPLWLLLAIAGLVLLIACANLANLMLARASAREREMAVRLALGAGRGRLVSSMMVESLVLAAAGAGVALLVCWPLSHSLVSLLATEESAPFLALGVDWRVVAFATAAALLTCAVFGLSPALRATRVPPAEAMRAGARGNTAGRRAFGQRRALVASQVALTLVLLTGALLFTRSLGNLASADVGLQTRGVLVGDIDFSALDLGVERRAQFKEGLVTRFGALPGVSSVAEVGIVPLSGGGVDNAVWIDGRDRASGLDANFNWIGGAYFETFGIPLLAGRTFDRHDTPRSPAVAIVNETLARRLGLLPSPLGRRLVRESTPSAPEAVFEIVGLAKDTKARDIHKGVLPMMFLASSQDPKPDPFVQVALRSDAPMADVAARIRRSLKEVDPRITGAYWTVEGMIRDSLLPERLTARLSAVFAFLATVLAAVGLYGAVSYMIARRASEIGIRMALGADRGHVLRMVLKETLALVVTGIAVGVPCALAAARLASGLLFGLRFDDPASLGLATTAMVAVGALAGYLPARRATRVDPLTALRSE